MQSFLRFSSSKILKCTLHSNSYAQRNGPSVTVCCKASEILNWPAASITVVLLVLDIALGSFLQQ